MKELSFDRMEEVQAGRACFFAIPKMLMQIKALEDGSEFLNQLRKTNRVTFK